MSRGRAAAPVGLPFLLLLFVTRGCLAANRPDDDPAPPDYGAALSKSLLYFEAQRSGRLPHNQRVPWRGHSGLTDGLQQGVDLVGGYYDAGDHVKFGLPMAFTVTMLAWGAIDFADDVQAAGEWGHTLEAIKWGTDYFVKAHTDPFVYWAEVCSCRCLYYLPAPAASLVFAPTFHKPTIHGVGDDEKKANSTGGGRGGRHPEVIDNSHLLPTRDLLP
jgi:hypothetical protein